MTTHDVVVVGASAGGVESLMRLVAGFTPGLPAAVFVVLHMPPDSPSALPNILDRAGPLPAGHAVDQEAIRPGRIYIARPNYHLYVHAGHVRVAVGPRENGSRPAVDVLFRTAARAYGPRVIGVVLSGALSDGALGLASIKLREGVAIVQDPEEALFVGMPLSALQATTVDYCKSVLEIAQIVDDLAHTPVEQTAVRRHMDTHPEQRERQDDERTHENQHVESGIVDNKAPGKASGLTCPECHGSIWELRDGDTVRFECRVGHAYAPEAFVAQQGERVEAALWTAINTLEERAETFIRLAGLYPASSHFANSYQERAHDTTEQAGILRTLLYSLVQSGDVG